MLPLIAVGMLAIVGMAGLAIDSSHAFVNVTRVQNALDAAALSAATALHNHDKNTTIATNHGQSTFAEHLEGELASSGVTVSFEYSVALNPFVATTNEPNFVRAVSDNHTIGIWFASVLPGVDDEWTIGSTAVSGPIPLLGGEVCDIAPLLVCGDPSDTTPNDGTIGGLPVGSVQCLKFGAGTNNGNGNGNGGGGNGNGNSGGPPEVCGEQAPDDPDGVGPGNYHLLSLGGNGGNVVRDNLAGGYQGCSSFSGTQLIDTAPGNKTGPVRDGLNTRFGDGSTSTYPADLVTTSPLTYSEYLTSYGNQNWTNSGGEEFRRIMAVPIGDCDGIQNGKSEIPIFGLGCYFLREKVGQGGQDNYIIGELIEDCDANGTPGDTTPALGGPQKIILFNDPGNIAS